MIKLALIGATGRMGLIVLKEANQNPNVEVVGALARPGNPMVGQDVGNLIGEEPLNIFITDCPEKAFIEAEVIIDFSRPEAFDRNLEEVMRHQKPYIVCITGLNDVQEIKLKGAAQEIPLIHAPNTSLGIALLRKLAVLAAEVLGPSYDISILEMHHRHKMDTPSGTSLSLAAALTKLEHLKKNKPPYAPLSPRPPGTIECVALRGGSFVCDHSVLFTSDKDMITLHHRAIDRSLFAQGALKAAQWLFKKPPGLYSMDDVVGLSL